jgi:hypothetical protein
MLKKNKKIWFVISLLSLLLKPIASFSMSIGEGDLAYIQGDYKNAYKFYMAESESGDSHAMTMLGCLYATGIGTSIVKRELAFKYFLSAARHGDLNGKINLAVAHASGFGTKKNIADAKEVLNSLDNNDIKTSNVLTNINKSKLLDMLESGTLTTFFFPNIDKPDTSSGGFQLPIQENHPTIQEPKKIDFSIAKKECANLGFKVGTEKFGKCILELTK